MSIHIGSEFITVSQDKRKYSYPVSSISRLGISEHDVKVKRTPTTSPEVFAIIALIPAAIAFLINLINSGGNIFYALFSFALVFLFVFFLLNQKRKVLTSVYAVTFMINTGETKGFLTFDGDLANQVKSTLEQSVSSKLQEVVNFNVYEKTVNNIDGVNLDDVELIDTSQLIFFDNSSAGEKNES